MRPTANEVEELRPGFGVTWRGYDRQEVQSYLRCVETELRLLTAEREAARAYASDVTRTLEAVAEENRDLRARVDRISRSPIEPDGLAERLGRMVELAKEESLELIREATEEAAATRERVAAQLREAQAHLASLAQP
ncbi:hypothetical protein [Amycolatopsis sp. NPDC059657]|uniref:hypothetical protein n=1 Tax=Amycolatopsis sp. NPDC059657 TaxID=3346899 RepID=UPI00366C5139